MQPTLLNFTTSDHEAGFRLDRLELYNWGTFDRKVWHIEPGGHNGLLTGDIGSGKSTLVDGLVTLLVPHHRIVYNKAAGAESRERSLYSYIRGEYKSEKDDLSQGARAVALRDESCYTVLLARFANKGLGLVVTLAQVFRLKPGQRNPERFFVVAEKPLSITKDFSDFGSSMADLRKKLRKQERLTLFSSFKDYANRFRQLFGIENEQALNLFYQTVSMKSVGNLTEFVRRHMLEKTDMETRITELRRNFDNLNQAHESVVKARARIEQLTPLVKDCRRYAGLAAEGEKLRQCREGLYPYFYCHKFNLLGRRLRTLADEIARLEQRLQSSSARIEELRVRESDLRGAIDDSGGRRLEELHREIRRLEKERLRVRERYERYAGLAEELSIPKAKDEDDFIAAVRQAEELLLRIEGESEKLATKLIDLSLELQKIRESHGRLEEELESLRGRRSNIPRRSLEIRRKMAETIGIAEEELPFVGELLQVAEEEKKWEGAIERLLHNFGLSLLVPDAWYGQVNHYVEQTNLKGRLVYFRVREKNIPPVATDDPDLLIHKVRIKPDSPFYDWLESELQRRFNYICCENLDRFQRLPKALTVHGLIKSGGRRHEKDDRHGLQDRRRFVLGWSNEEKIRALEEEARRMAAAGRQLGEKIAADQKRRHDLGRRRDHCRDFLQFQRFAEIHWQPIAGRIEELTEEQRQIEESSDLLRSLRRQLDRVRENIVAAERQRTKLTEKIGGKRNDQKHRQEEYDELAEYGGFLDDPANRELVAQLTDFQQQALGETAINLRNVDKCQSRVREYINRQISNADGRIKTITEAILRRMGQFKTAWPAETVEIDTSLAAAGEYEQMLLSLKKEDLPRHEARFKELLNEGTIKSIVLLQNQLERERQDIMDKINAINRSLKETEYNPGSYITLLTDLSQDADIRSFQQELKNCLTHSLGEDDLYNEAKFLEVKKLIDRFNGREGLVDLDRKWTAKVTDVRNWFTFSAIERWLEDDRDKEYYSDSSGKSGGQKEKLAYTILASALAYQFGLEWGAVRSRSFRFVVIDEAFGRGSDESTRYGLELFKRLNLQLLIVTPLQKIHVIENYIRSVHFVHNEGGRNSQLRNLSIEEYQREKRQRQSDDNS